MKKHVNTTKRSSWPSAFAPLTGSICTVFRRARIATHLARLRVRTPKCELPFHTRVSSLRLLHSSTRLSISASYKLQRISRKRTWRTALNLSHTRHAHSVNAKCAMLTLDSIEREQPRIKQPLVRHYRDSFAAHKSTKRLPSNFTFSI